MNADACIRMHMNAYGKKLHHFWEKTTPHPILRVCGGLATCGNRSTCFARACRQVVKPYNLLGVDPTSYEDFEAIFDLEEFVRSA
jgi:hypothetical protein